MAGYISNQYVNTVVRNAQSRLKQYEQDIKYGMPQYDSYDLKRWGNKCITNNLTNNYGYRHVERDWVDKKHIETIRKLLHPEDCAAVGSEGGTYEKMSKLMIREEVEAVHRREQLTDTDRDALKELVNAVENAVDRVGFIENFGKQAATSGS